ncbi:hypothetical protein BJX70DRAFT_394276 [Aspergillus crustosus]
MSNRDYYGDNVPAHLAVDNAPPQYTLQPTGSISSQSTQQPWLGPATNPEQALNNQQGQWRDSQPQTASYGPEGFNNAPGGEGEKGLGSTIVGGTAGGFMGHHVGKKSDHGVLGTVGGAVAGAIIANVASNAVKGHTGHGRMSARDRRRERLENRLGALSGH